MFNLKKRLQQATLGILVFMMLISVPASARQVKTDAPQTYTVKKGDTLWDIAVARGMRNRFPKDVGSPEDLRKYMMARGLGLDAFLATF